ncbi:MAG: ATP-dependent Clp protease ATP-binding subunit [Eubacterium sp.]|nr:ATP-dependent Clp protease ATP-binding subunit [Eubacterium sp.]
MKDSGKNYSNEAARALRSASRYAAEHGHIYVGTEHLLMGLLIAAGGVASYILTELHVDQFSLGQNIDRLIQPAPDSAGIQEEETRPEYTPRLLQVLDSAETEAIHFGQKEIGTEHLLLAILKDAGCNATKLLVTMHVNVGSVFDAVLKGMNLSSLERKEELQRLAGRQEKEKGSSALEAYGRDLTALAREGKLDPVIGREKEIERVLQIISRRTKNNPCMIGEPGVGKTAIVEGLAERIASGNVPEPVRQKKIISLDMTSIVAGSKYRGEFEERMKHLVCEAAGDENVLLFVDEMHTIIGAGGAEGALDASNILKPSLSRGEIQLIGATTTEEYRKYIEKDSALERRFQPVMVEQPSREETVRILEGLKPLYEKHHKVTITEEAIQAAVDMSDRYINDRFLPDKAIDLMDESCARLRLEGFRTDKETSLLMAEEKKLGEEKEELLRKARIEEARELQVRQDAIRTKLERRRKNSFRKEKAESMSVTEDTISRTVASWTGIPLEKIRESESARLVRLEEILHKRIVGQGEAVTAVAKAIRRGRVGLKDPKRPIGSFLFLGPTGVGKTELCKAVAEAVFGSEDNMIRIDMSEYMEPQSVSKMIGSPPGYVGYDEGGQLSEKVRRHPYSVLLFDEIEKAHPDVFNILLQVLDDGHITDAQGRKVSFRETIIIMTSNAGASRILQPKKLGFGAAESRETDYRLMKGQVMEEVRRLFRPEFLNRIDEILVFRQLDKEDMMKIVDILMHSLTERSLHQMKISLGITEEAKEKLVLDSYDSKYGARPLKRAIQTEIEDPLSEEILRGRIKRGDTVEIGTEEGKLTFHAVR